ncbi:MAG: hypothetical protein LRZ84_21845 [Desertifilum sp.]|nr:hypothetical protein [Desertifilum sp.]
MADSFNLQPSSILEPLGLKHPLVPSPALGQNWIQPQFIVPLGARSLNVLNPSLFFAQAMPESNLPEVDFNDSPFFSRSRPSPTPANLQTFSETQLTPASPEVANFSPIQTELVQTEPNLDEGIAHFPLAENSPIPALQSQLSPNAESEPLRLSNPNSIQAKSENPVLPPQQTLPTFATQPDTSPSPQGVVEPQPVSPDIQPQRETNAETIPVEDSTVQSSIQESASPSQPPTSPDTGNSSLNLPDAIAPLRDIQPTSTFETSEITQSTGINASETLQRSTLSDNWVSPEAIQPSPSLDTAGSVPSVENASSPEIIQPKSLPTSPVTETSDRVASLEPTSSISFPAEAIQAKSLPTSQPTPVTETSDRVVSLEPTSSTSFPAEAIQAKSLPTSPVTETSDRVASPAELTSPEIIQAKSLPTSPVTENSDKVVSPEPTSSISPPAELTSPEVIQAKSLPTPEFTSLAETSDKVASPETTSPTSSPAEVIQARSLPTSQPTPVAETSDRVAVSEEIQAKSAIASQDMTFGETIQPASSDFEETSPPATLSENPVSLEQTQSATSFSESLQLTHRGEHSEPVSSPSPAIQLRLADETAEGVEAISPEIFETSVSLPEILQPIPESEIVGKAVSQGSEETPDATPTRESQVDSTPVESLPIQTQADTSISGNLPILSDWTQAGEAIQNQISLGGDETETITTDSAGIPTAGEEIPQPPIQRLQETSDSLQRQVNPPSEIPPTSVNEQTGIQSNGGEEGDEELDAAIPPVSAEITSEPETRISRKSISEIHLSEQTAVPDESFSENSNLRENVPPGIPSQLDSQSQPEVIRRQEVAAEEMKQSPVYPLESIASEVPAVGSQSPIRLSAEVPANSRPDVVEESLPELPTVLQNLGTLKPLGQPLQASLKPDEALSPDWVQAKAESGISHRLPEVASENRSYLDPDIPSVVAEPVYAEEISVSPPSLRRRADYSPSLSSTIEKISSFSPDVNRKPVDSWDSIADLLGQTTGGSRRFSSPNIEPTIVQPLRDESQWDDDLWGGFTNPSTAQTASHYSGFEDVESASPVSSSPPANSRLESDLTGEQPIHEVESEANQQPERSSANPTQNLELLASEIYHLLRQRLEIERERQGGYYSGRLPW